MYKFRYTLESSDAQSIFKIESWYKLKNETSIKLDRYISKLQKKIKQLIYNNRNQYNCDSNYIVSLNMKSSGINTKKPTYMSCDIILNSDDKIKNQLFLKDLDQLITNNELFVFYPEKINAL